ncbi:MAG TPA: YciI family protein [Candidatus Limnocylindrales bacterium]|nr:YciI family protein [Candidatus Limnocylindrales bacterium]
MRYLFLLWGDEAAEEAMTDAARRAIVESHMAFSRTIRDEGRVVTGEPLGPSRNGLVVRRNYSVTDGPFLESKEQLGGFYVIDCRDDDDATAVAARVPSSPGLTIEIRAIPE